MCFYVRIRTFCSPGWGKIEKKKPPAVYFNSYCPYPWLEHQEKRLKSHGWSGWSYFSTNPCHTQSKSLPLNGSIRLSFPLHYWHYHYNNMQTLITEFNSSPQLLMTLGRDFKGRYSHVSNPSELTTLRAFLRRGEKDR